MLYAIISFVMLMTTPMKFDFGTGNLTNWSVVNDVVMGGRSSSSVDWKEGTMLFTGNVSLENNGGFASVRGPLEKVDLSHYKTVRIRYRSTGRDFALRLSTTDRYYLPHYKQFFSDATGKWKEEQFNLSGFQEFVMGDPTGSTIQQGQLENIVRIGIILSDKKEGPFELEVDYILFE